MLIRLMAGHQFLVLSIVVRVHDKQQYLQVLYKVV